MRTSRKCDTKLITRRNVDHVAWYRNDQEAKPNVGQRKPNKWNLFDMSGNVMNRS